MEYISQSVSHSELFSTLKLHVINIATKLILPPLQQETKK